MKVLLVVAIGVAVGVAIELVLARRQRARRVVLDAPDLPPGLVVDPDEAGRARRRDRSRGIDAVDSTVVFDDEGGFRILGPVEYEVAGADIDGGSGPHNGDGAGGDGGGPEGFGGGR